MGIRLITDSSCDLNDDIVKKYNIDVLPLTVSFEDKTYIDGQISKSHFYEKMKTQKTLPKTACSSPDEFKKRFEGEEDEIIVITITSKLSGVYSTANLGKSLFEEENKSKKIALIDSEMGCMAHGLLVYIAAKMIENGNTFEEIVSHIEKIKKEVVCYGTLETLENAIKGGRINPIAGKIINALNLKAIIRVNDGEVKPIDKARGENNSLNKVVAKMNENIDKNKKDKILFVGHANNVEKANKVVELMKKDNEFAEIIVCEIGCVMGVYTSEGAIIVSCY
ncbi:MAG: DegV family protein [Peptostreptococcaceae bacterium]